MGLGIKSFLQYKAGELLGRHPAKFAGHYTVWRSKRIRAILNHYSVDLFAGKSVMELGAGYGDIGAFFAQLGADVTCVEGRESNTRNIRKRYPFVRAVTHDLNDGLPKLSAAPRVIIHMGVLYHLREPEKSLRESCRNCEHLILETECSDSDDPHFVGSARETAYLYDQSLDGVGSRPSPAFIERILAEEGMSFERITDARCNSDVDFYDWPVKNTKLARHGQRGMWFARASPSREKWHQSGTK